MYSEAFLVWSSARIMLLQARHNLEANVAALLVRLTAMQSMVISAGMLTLAWGFCRSRNLELPVRWGAGASEIMYRSSGAREMPCKPYWKPSGRSKRTDFIQAKPDK